MKWYILIFATFFISSVSAVDCWQLTNETGRYECQFLNLPSCPDKPYYSEYLNCQSDAQKARLPKEKNFFETIITNNIPGLQNIKIIEYFYQFNDFELFTIIILFTLIVIAIKGGKFK